MAFTIGIDIGAISVNIGIIGDPEDRHIIESLRNNSGGYSGIGGARLPFFILPYTRIKGEPVKATLRLLREHRCLFDAVGIREIRACGSGDSLINRYLRVNVMNEFTAMAKGVEFLSPQISTIFEIGGANSRYLKLERDGTNDSIGLLDYNKSGDCAAGTGAFLDQQASRMKYNIEEVGEVTEQSARAAKIAGRCSVFAKSDMIHAQQKGYQPGEILKGLCEAVARNFKSNIVCGKPVTPPVAFLGGVAANKGVVNALRSLYDFNREELIVPPLFHWYGALGAAFLEYEHSGDREPRKFADFRLEAPTNHQQSDNSSVHRPLTLGKVVLLRDKLSYTEARKSSRMTEAYLGIDIGSVSTNLAVIDTAGRVLKEIYTKTESRPIEVVHRGLQDIHRELGEAVEIKGVGTTGSGRELIGKLIGADTIVNEITAHKTGAVFVGENMLHKRVDTIFEIGGQDSKYISIEDGVVVDFAMNEACAAGTGSFLEERAEELDINIRDQFALLALQSKQPIQLGERCTVFMERDVTAHQQQGAMKEDLVGGLAYSVVYNYLNRVVRSRRIGDVIFFQGGTAYNNAVAAAFSRILNKEIIVPPYNGVIGAIGAALLAMEKMRDGLPSSFRGYSLEKIDYTLREFTCKACSNYCNMQAFKVEDQTTYWGDQCSDKFRDYSGNGTTADIDDLFSLYEHILYEGYDPERNTDGISIGLPRCMYMYEWFPFWNAFFSELGFRAMLSYSSNKKVKNLGQEATLAEPCFPVTVSHGHVLSLLRDQADYVLLPNMINDASHTEENCSYYCPWGQTLPFTVGAAPGIAEYGDRLLTPMLEFGYGEAVVRKSLYEMVRRFGISKRQSDTACDAAYEKQTQYQQTLYKYGDQALEKLQSMGQKGIVIIGRPYNIYDSGVNLDIPKKLRDYYGVNLIPFNFLNTTGIQINEINDNMYWHYGKKILATARLLRDLSQFDLMYLTNFKCGPDSYIKHFISDAVGKPYLTLQFDEHGNDAGYLTRCEAYLTSKGFLG